MAFLFRARSKVRIRNFSWIFWMDFRFLGRPFSEVKQGAKIKRVVKTQTGFKEVTTLGQIMNGLVTYYSWKDMGTMINIKCFNAILP